MDNPKVAKGKNDERGEKIIAHSIIAQGEVIAEFDGCFYEWESEAWNQDLEDHTIQCAKRVWRDSKGIARLINHSCEPNCGIKDLFKIVAMKDIKVGEEITWDYDMSELNDESQWVMNCECGTPSCRKIISGFEKLPQEIKDKYKGYLSEWLLNTK